MTAGGEVARTFPVANSTDRIVLLRWSTNEEALIRNVIRVDPLGNVVWRADLPGDAARDCFVSLASDGATFVARTYSDCTVRLDADGQVGIDERPFASA